MNQLTPEEFEALWEKAHLEPELAPAVIQPVQIDFSLSRILDRYVEMAGRSLAAGEIKQADHDALTDAVARLKPVLSQVDETKLVGYEMARRARARGKKRGKK